jgi:4-aminobutyrate aminotransferase-like enzyme
VEAIQRQAAELIHYSASDFFLPIYTEVCEHLDRIAPMSRPVRSFLTNSGTEAVEAAIKLARYATGRQYIVGFFNSFHGRSYGSVSVTASKSLYRANFGPMLPGVVHAPYGDGRDFGNLDFGEDGGPFPTIDYFEKVLFKRLVEPTEIAAVIVEPVLGEGGYIVPPDGWLEALRDLCTRHGILMVADEVMAGFGRTGRWFAIDHWDTVPDLMTMAKGLTSSYLPLGAVAMSRKIAEKFETQMYYGGLTYSSHAVSCAAAIATIGVYEEDGLIQNAARLDNVMRQHHERLYAKHPSVGAYRNLGLFGILDLVRTREPFTPMTPFNGTSDEMKAIAKYLRDNGLYTMIANNSIHTNPPLCITQEQLAEGFDIIDAALDIADRGVASA